MTRRSKMALARGDLLLWIVMCAACMALLAWSFIRYGAAGDESRATIDRDESVLTAPPFTLTNQDGQPFDSRSLSGKVWVCDFVFTNCAGPCPIMTDNMATMQRTLAERKGLEFVSFTCDPMRDTPEVFRRFAKQHGADFSNWNFLTGDYDEIQRIAASFLISVVNDSADGQLTSDQLNDQGVNVPVVHSTRFILVDRSGRVVGTYQGTDGEELNLLLADIEAQLGATNEGWFMALPAVNASLNAIAAGLLVAGLVFVKQGHLRRHKYAMVSAFCVSILFLVSYVTFHTLRQAALGSAHTTWEVDGPWRLVYYSVLLTHVVLAAVVPFLALRTLWLGLTDQITKHRKWAKITWPIWMYVSVTGVVVYFMLYQLHPMLLAS